MHYNVGNRNWYAAFVTTDEEEEKVKEYLKHCIENRLRIIVQKHKLRERKDEIWKYNIRTFFSGDILLTGI